MSEAEVQRAHGFHTVRVKQIVEETDDTRSFVLDVPPDLAERFAYRSGQFCTFRVRIDGEEYLRSYSMSSAPGTDTDLTVTVKRVPGGKVSNWFIDRLEPGAEVETTRPAGVFCLRDGSEPIVAFCGGSGITPVMSIVKTALATTGRSVRVVYANRSPASVIFAEQLDRLQARHPGRLEVHYHFDDERGLLERAEVAELAGTRTGAHFYICGPGPFMDLVESSLREVGADAANIFIERFSTATSAEADVAGSHQVGDGPTDTPEKITIVMRGRKTAVPYQPGDTLLETARRAALNPPFSCESGSCATCMAILRDGSAKMRVNDALTPEEVEEGWVLTCQAVPEGATVTVEYD